MILQHWEKSSQSLKDTGKEDQIWINCLVTNVKSNYYLLKSESDRQMERGGDQTSHKILKRV